MTTRLVTVFGGTGFSGVVSFGIFATENIPFVLRRGIRNVANDCSV